MTGIEIENFYNADSKEYVLSMNEEFKNLLKVLEEKDNYTPIISVLEMQDLMSRIVSFYEFKYPDNMFYQLRCIDSFDKVIADVAKKLDFYQLKYRISHDQCQFLDCNYGQCLTIKKNKAKLWEPSMTFLNVNSDGTFDKFDLNRLVEDGFVDSVNEDTTIDELYGKLFASSKELEYDSITEAVVRHKDSIIVRNEILKLIPLNMIYSDSSLPEYGIVRAKSFIRSFNKEYELDLNLDKVLEIMDKDYSNQKVKK